MTDLNNQTNQPTSQPHFAGKYWLWKSCMILVVTATICSCARPDELVVDTAVDTTIEFRSPPFSNPPSYVGDRLYFDDFAHFAMYFLELDSLLTADTDIFDSIVLATSPVETINDLLTTDSYTSTPFETFLTDPVMRAVVNPYYEFQIDDVLVTFINNSEILTSDASNSSLRTSIRAVPKGVPLDITEIPSGAFWSDDKDIEQALAIVCGCTISIRPFDCETLRVFGRCNSFFGGEGDGEVTMTYDQDGAPINPIGILTEEVSGNYEFFVEIGFRESGFISATINPDCVTANNKTATYNYDASTYAACDEGERSIAYNVTSGNERMWVRTSFHKNHLADYHSAEIKGWTLVGSSWENHKASLKTRVDANRKSVGCSLLDSKYDEKASNNKRRKIVSVSWTSHCAHCDGDLIGTYRKMKSGVTLDDVQDVEFICCE